MDELRIGAVPRELIPGDVEAIFRLGFRLEGIADGCGEAARQLGGLRAANWEGEAAEAVADALDQEPAKYSRAAGAFRDAAIAVRRYADTLEEAQHDAQRAIYLFERAASWQTRTETQAGTDPPQPQTVDPDIARARSILQAARERVEHEAEIAAGRLSAAADAAPNKPDWGSRFLHGAGEFVGGAAEATWGTAKFAWSVSSVRMVTDPMGWARDVKGIGEGLVWGATHPVAFGKEILDWETWQENPARAAGRLAPEIALTLATAGVGAGAKAGSAARKAVGAAKKTRSAKKAKVAKHAADTAENVRSANRGTDLANHKPRQSSKMDEERRTRLQRDSDHGGETTENSKREAEIAEDLEARGIVHGVDRYDRPGQGDFFDVDGQQWDIKSPKSREALEDKINAELRARGAPERTFDPYTRIRGEFNVGLVSEWKDLISEKGWKIVLDHRDLSDADFQAVREAVEKEGLGDHFVWYP